MLALLGSGYESLFLHHGLDTGIVGGVVAAEGLDPGACRCQPLTASSVQLELAAI